MPRKLYITDEMGLDDALTDIAQNDLSVALMWPWIIPYLDDWGRGEANARRIKGKIFPNFPAISFEVVETMLQLFASTGLIELYKVAGKRYMAVEREKWFRFQTHIHASKRTSEGSRYPAPPSDAQETQEEAPRVYAEVREAPREIAEVREAPRVHAEKRASPSPSPSPSLSPSPSNTGNEKDASVEAAALPPGENAVKIFIDLFTDKIGEPPDIPPRFTKPLKETMSRVGRDRYRAAISAFLSDGWGAETGYSVQTFVSMPVDRWTRAEPKALARASPASKNGATSTAEYYTARLDGILKNSHS